MVCVGYMVCEGLVLVKFKSRSRAYPANLIPAGYSISRSLAVRGLSGTSYSRLGASH
jgi:hypothetical protein